MPHTPRRQPAYDAIFAYIREHPPRSADDYGQAVENARVWRAVEAALDAMEAATADLDNAWRTEVAQLRAQLAQLDRDAAPVSLSRVVEQLDRVVLARQTARPGWHRADDGREWGQTSTEETG